MTLRSMLVVFLFFASAVPALACKQSTGETTRDKTVAAWICSKFATSTDVTAITVQQQLIMNVHLTLELYRGLRADEVFGEKMLRDFHKLFLSRTGKNSATVNLYVDGDKVADAQSTLLSGTRVRLRL